MSFCSYTREVAGVVHSCEHEAGHVGDHMFAFTAGQLKALEYALEHPKAPSFPSEVVLLFFAAIGVELFANQRTALDHAVSLVMVATAIRWVRQWVNERRR